MSRRLENIQTGFVDYGGAAANLSQAFEQGKRIQFAEEDRQRRIQQEEDARMAGGAQLYAGWMDEVNKMENGLDQEARLKFVEKFNEVKEGYRGLQEAISKGVKVGTPQYYELYNQVNNKKKSVIESISNIKQLNETSNEIAKNYASGIITRPEVIESVKNTRNAILNGTWTPSDGLVTPQQVVMNSYKPASSTIKAISTAIPFTTSIDEDYQQEKGGKKVIKTTRYVPSLSGSIAAIDNFFTNSSPRETIDITNKLASWKAGENPSESSNYKYYVAYMNTEAVKKDPQYGGGIKQPEQFTETDYALMESLPAKFKPNAKEVESFATSSQKKNYDTEIIAKDFMDKLFSGDPKKENEVLDNFSGGLASRGFIIKRGTKVETPDGIEFKQDPNGKDVQLTKVANEWDTGTTSYLSLKGGTADKAAALDFINRFNSAIGKGGKYIMRQK
jgi:hypothetical protein